MSTHRPQSNRKASQLLGVTLQSSFTFRFRLGKKHSSIRDDPDVDSTEHTSDSASSYYYESDPSLASPSPSSDGHDSAEHDGEGDLFVWDVPNPFAPPDPSQAHLQALMQAEIAQMRRYESIGPLQSLPDQDQPLHDWDESESESESGDYGDGHNEDDDDYEDGDNEDGDHEDSDDYGDDEDEDGDDENSDDLEEDEGGDSDADNADKPNVIVLPKLLPIPLRFIPLPHPPSPPPPSPSPSSSASASASDEDPPALWHDLAQVYNNIAEAEELERTARKAKRDAHRSRLKALAILGPEAASAI